MLILVAYASKHGSTEGIAERVAETLAEAGLEAEARAVGTAVDLAPYDAFVIGSAAYFGHWMKEAAAFVRRNRALLADRPVWLFSSGPLGTEAVDAEGNDVREAAEPTEIAELREAIHARDHRVFFGALNPSELTFTERSIRRLPASRAILPEGDFRDWADVEEWASGIARDMAEAPRS